MSALIAINFVWALINFCAAWENHRVAKRNLANAEENHRGAVRNLENSDKNLACLQTLRRIQEETRSLLVDEPEKPLQ